MDFGASVAPTPGAPEVVRLAGRPALRAIVREGDPAAAVAVAVTTAAGAPVAAALAAVLQTRLGERGFAVELASDAAGLRAVWFPARAERVRDFLEALRDSLGRPVTAADGSLLDAVRGRVGALPSTHPEAPALWPIARCTATPVPDSPAIDPGAPDPVLALAVDGWRSRAFGSESTALGSVGDAELTAALAAGLDASEGWPHLPAATTPLPSVETTEPLRALPTYASPSLPQGAVRLDLAVHTAGAFAAVLHARRLGGAWEPARLSWPSWARGFRLAEVRATALPGGGCVSLGFAATSPLSAEELGEQVARLVRAVEQELRLPLDGAGDERDAAARTGVFGASDPREAAAAAAWWEASARGDESSEAHESRGSLAGALGVSALGGAVDPDAAARAVEQGLATLSGPPQLELRTIFERGQAELWLLAAPTCGLGQEGATDAGALALAATAAAGVERDGVSLEPWISADGAGLLGHAPARAGESAADWGRRVARTVGLAAALAAHGAEGFGAAQARLAVLGSSTSSRVTRALVERLLPEHPSWLSPMPDLDSVTRATREAVGERWRAAWAGGVRLAVLAPAGAAQAEAAGRELARWLEPEGKAACRPERARQRAGGLHFEAGLPSGYVVAAASFAPGLADHGELLRSWLAGPGGPLDRLSGPIEGWAVHRLGGSRVGAVSIEVRARHGELEAARAALGDAIAAVRDRVTLADFEAIVRANEAASLARSTDPRARVALLWTDQAGAAAPEAASWRAFVRETLSPDAILWLQSR